MRGLVRRPPWALSGWVQLPTTTAPPPPYLCRPCRLLAAAAAAVAPTTTSTLPVALSGMRVAGRRGIQISAAPATEFPKQSSVATDAFGATAGDKPRDDADARFEVLGSPYSLLSVALSASQPLYTRRGTLVAVAGKVANAHSTLTVLPPVRRALLGIPFLYQRIASPTPLTLLVGTRAAATTLFTLHLDGTTDWVVAQRNALLAWTGHTLAITPRRAAGAAGLGVAHWGQSYVTGRGLVQREAAADDPSAPTPSSSSSSSSSSSDAVAVHVATVRPDGKVEFTDAKDLKEFVR
ncbi:mitochondrial protein [Niveomyces insectorum RCEF 264]|uniref:Altered inheritance of mitochondria protein 24, mitochondrial n=1 Tax=Niveomyces insectorum RCEF 264 TaxID=1081102 RepID=A0A167SFJ2_9HYPO|nr:mitochondrial protein [Niveomyces insectorum RCEF 264]